MAARFLGLHYQDIHPPMLPDDRNSIIAKARGDQVEAAVGYYVKDKPTWESMREALFDVFGPIADTALWVYQEAQAEEERYYQTLNTL